MAMVEVGHVRVGMDDPAVTVGMRVATAGHVDVVVVVMACVVGVLVFVHVVVVRMLVVVG